MPWITEDQLRVFEEYVNAAIHKNLHLTHPTMASLMLPDRPPPRPWVLADVVSSLSSAINLLQLATQMNNPQVIDTVQQRIDGIIDDWCGTRPPGVPFPWPWPPPPPSGLSIAAELVNLANQFPDARVRDMYMEVAGRAFNRAMGGASKAG